MNRDTVLVELLAIYEQHSTVTPELVLEAATPDEHPLHDEFTWDDTEAAHNYRLNEARSLIRSVKIRPVDPEAPSDAVRAFVSVRPPSGPSNYQPTERVDDAMSQRLVLAQMRRDIDTLKRRYGHLAAFWDYLSNISKAS